MSSGKEESPRRRWSDYYCRKLDENSVMRGPERGPRFACPCCRCSTLTERGGFEICPVCYWEDDGQDDHDSSAVRGGPNGTLSLDEARRNYAEFGACDRRSTEHVRLPRPEERPTES